MSYKVDLTVSLRPIWHEEAPQIKISCHDQMHDIILDSHQTINFQFKSRDRQRLVIEFLNKKDTDVLPDLGLDKAVIIERVAFFDIADPKFIWTALYRPRYPEPWYSQQVASGQTPLPELYCIDKLGWNGTWTLEFDLPIFTWIHRIQNLGWIYD